jgi:hypothetical protein
LLQINVKHDIKDLERKMRRFERQIPFTTARALTETAKIAKEDTQKEIQRVFKQPKPFTVKGVYVRSAKKRNLVATVGLKEITAEYLQHQVKKRDRNIKGAEHALRKRGLLPKNGYIVPGPAVRLNKYGNIAKATLNRILSGAIKRNGEYFAAHINGIGGVWKRGKGRRVRLMLAFIDKPKYTPRLKFNDLVKRSVRNNIREQFKLAAEAAIRSAK